MSRAMLPSRGIAGVTVALLGLALGAYLAGYDPWTLAFTAWLLVAFLGPILCIGVGWLDTRPDGARGGQRGDKLGAAPRMPRMTPPASRLPNTEELPRSGWVPLLYFAAVVYLLVSVIVGFKVVSVTGRGPVAAGILWMFAPMPLIALWFRHRPDLVRTVQLSERSRMRLANRLARSSPRKSGG